METTKQTHTMKKSSLTFIFFFIAIFIFQASLPANSQTDSCDIDFNFNDLLKFDTTALSCQSVWQAQGFILRYKKVGSKRWRFLLSAPNRGGYVAIGFSDSESMIGSSAMVGWPQGGSTGAVKQYYLGDRTVVGVKPDQGDLDVVANSTAVIVQSSRIYLTFQLAASQPSDHLIFSVGSPGFQPRSPNYQLQKHTSQTAVQFNYDSGQAETQKSPYTGLKRAHGALNILSWGILVPVGALIARYFRRWDPIWFYSHAAVQTLGFVFGLTAVILGLVLEGLVHAGNIVTHHKGLGVTILVLGCLQVTAVLARPKKGSKARKYWNWFHHIAGRLVIALAVVNVYYGISLANESAIWAVFYALIVVIMVAAGVFLEIKHRREED